MKKLKKHNPVAKFAPRYNKAVTFRDRKNDYKRRERNNENYNESE